MLHPKTRWMESEGFPANSVPSQWVIYILWFVRSKNSDLPQTLRILLVPWSLFVCILPPSAPLKKKKLKSLFIWLHWVLIVACKIFHLHCGLRDFFVVACRILSCSMWDPVPWPGIKPEFPALGAWSLSHWTTSEVPFYSSWLCQKKKAKNKPQISSLLSDDIAPKPVLPFWFSSCLCFYHLNLKIILMTDRCLLEGQEKGGCEI